MTTTETQPSTVDLYNSHLYSASALALDGLLRLAGNYEVEVWDKLPDGQAGILAPKHSGVMDIPLLGAATRHIYGRNIRFITKQGLVEGYNHSDMVRSYFEHMGGIIINQSSPINEQIAGRQIQRDIKNRQLIASFNEAGVSPGREVATTKKQGRDVAKTKKIGALAVPNLTPVQPVGMAGTEGNWRAWVRPKFVVYGNVIYPEPPEDFDPENKRTYAKYARTFSEEVDAMMQTATNRAHQLHSRRTVPMSGRWH